MCSCTAVKQPRWSGIYPTETASPWNRLVDLSYSNTPVETAIADLESRANAFPGTSLELSVGRLPTGPWDEERASSVPITFSAKQIPVQEAFRIIAQVSGYHALFNENRGVLAPYTHGHGEITVFLTGRCIDAATGEPIQGASLSQHFEKLDVRKAGAYIHPITVEGITMIRHIDEQNSMIESKPMSRDYHFVITAPGYQPHVFIISTGQWLSYTNTIELKKDIPTTKSTPTK